MPKSIKDYKDKDKFRAYRNKQRKINYDRGWIDSHSRAWTTEEELLVLSSNKTDRELSKEIERSVTAIQARRCKLNHMKDNFKFNNF